MPLKPKNIIEKKQIDYLMLRRNNSGTAILLILFFILLSSSTGCVRQNSAPVASMNMDFNTIQINSSINVTSISIDSDGYIKNTTWFLNDDAIGTGQNISFKVFQSGVYLLKLTVIDNDGASDSIERSFVAGEFGVDVENIKEKLLGTWKNYTQGQTGTWIFYQNNSLKSQWQGEYGASVVDYWDFSVDKSKLCFFNPRDELLDEGCYNYSFSNNYKLLTVTYYGNIAIWEKID